jgi:hypothetical protein
MLDMFMHKEINVLGASNSVMQSRGNLKHYLNYWLNFPNCVEQQSNSTLAVAAIHATTSGTNLMNL